jgi:hypothetical protein
MKTFPSYIASYGEHKLQRERGKHNGKKLKIKQTPLETKVATSCNSHGA